ncbi:MAG TPA: hypothetical protein VF310_12980 [Vicinamibacteria bacterium]
MLSDVSDTRHAMHDNILTALRRLTDDELLERTKECAANERQATAALVAHLAELDTRDIPLGPVQVTIDGETLQKLRLAQALLRDDIPSGDEAAILDLALTALLE